MNKLIPIANIVLSIVALFLGLCGFAFAVLKSVVLFSAFAITLIVISFTLSAVVCGFGFAFTKSKLCVAAGIISAVSLVLNVVSFVILL